MGLSGLVSQECALSQVGTRPDMILDAARA